MRRKIFNVRLNDSEKREKYFDKLINDIINNKCILMVGSGISQNSFGKNRKNLPNWYQFLDSFINWQYENNKYTKKDFFEIKKLLRDKSKFQIIAGDLIERTNKEEFKEFLEDTFSPKAIYPSYLHDLLCLFPFRAIITTNYDNLIEKAFYELNKRFPKIISYIDIKKGAEIPQNFFIAKIHGDINDPSTVVISQIDYMNLIHRNPNYIKFLKNIFQDFTILFTGYSFSDPDIQFIVNKLSFEDNYCYLITDIEEISQIECERYFKDRKIITLEFDNIDKSYNRLDEGFEQLLDLTLIKYKKLCSSILPLWNRNHFSVMVLYGKKDQHDGFFLQDYFYRKKKRIVNPNHKGFNFSNFLEDFSIIAPSVDFFVIYIGKAKVNKTKSNFLKAINMVEKFKKDFPYKIVIVATPDQKQIIGDKFPDYPTFFLKENFSDIDISPIFNYTSDLFSYKLKSTPSLYFKSTTCAYYQSKYDFWDKDSFNLYLKHKNKVEDYSELLRKGDYKNALSLIDNLLSLPEFHPVKNFFQEIIYDKIKCKFMQKEYKECLELFDLYKIDAINDDTFEIFKLKAISLSVLGLFEDSMKVADELENNCINLREIQKIIILKLNIFENTHKCLERVIFINKCLDDLPNELECIVFLNKALELCLGCTHYDEQLEKSK